MSTINITNARQNLFQLVSDLNIGFNPITIVNNKEKELKKIANSFQRNFSDILEKIIDLSNGNISNKLIESNEFAFNIVLDINSPL